MAREKGDRLSVFLQLSLKEEDGGDYPKDVPSLALAAGTYLPSRGLAFFTASGG